MVGHGIVQDYAFVFEVEDYKSWRVKHGAFREKRILMI
jgi:hypothetical protein